MNKIAYERLMGLTLNKQALSLGDTIEERINKIREQQRQRAHEQIDSTDTGFGPIGDWHIKRRGHSSIDKRYAGKYTPEDMKDDAYFMANVGAEPLAEGSIKRQLIERAPVYGASMLAGGTIGSAIAGEGNRLTGFGIGSATAALMTLLGRKLYYGKQISW